MLLSFFKFAVDFKAKNIVIFMINSRNTFSQMHILAKNCFSLILFLYFAGDISCLWLFGTIVMFSNAIGTIDADFT